MRAGLDRDIRYQALAPPAPLDAASELMWTMCNFAPASRARAAARWIASTSATTGREFK